MSYLLAKMVEEMLVIFCLSLVVSAAIFFAVGFHGNFVLFWLVYLVTISIGMGRWGPVVPLIAIAKLMYFARLMMAGRALCARVVYAMFAAYLSNQMEA